jgi:hypothetical protein
MRNQLAPLSETVKKLHAEWKEFQKLEKLEHKISKYSVDYAWSFYAKCKNELDGEIQVRDDYVWLCNIWKDLFIYRLLFVTY